MPNDRLFELEDALLRPGCYLNPQTEVMIVVDDSPSIDGEIFNLEEFEGAEWVLIADEVPIDEARRDELLESFQATYHGGDGRAVSEAPVEEGGAPVSSRSPRSSRTLSRYAFSLPPSRCAPQRTPLCTCGTSSASR